MNIFIRSFRGPDKYGKRPPRASRSPGWNQLV